MEIKFKKKITNKKIAKYDKERNYILGINKSIFKNINKQFKYYKEDFNRNIELLTNKMETKLNLSYNKNNTNNTDIEKNKKIIKDLKLNKFIKKKLLPSINYTVRNKVITPLKEDAKSETSFKTNKRQLKKVRFNKFI